MKPLELRLQAFGSFAKEITIDFAKLGKDGIFLIVGETGSGKTTIFDAICYALYGEPNGSDRNIHDFRSHFASNDTKTFVRLKFEHHGRIYIVYRCSNTDDIYVKDIDDNILAKKSTKTTQFIKNLIGLSSEQFKQIVMIAQGEFKTFLLANSDKKGDILNTIFGTQKFVDFKNMIGTKAKYFENDFKNYQSIAISRLHSIRYSSSCEYANEFDSLKNSTVITNKRKNDTSNIKTISEILNMLQKYIVILKEEQSFCDSEFNSINLKCEKLSQKINEVSILNENIKKRDSVKFKLEYLNSQEDTINRYQKEIGRLKDAKSIEVNYSNYKYVESETFKLQKEVTVLEISLKKYSQEMELLKNRQRSIEERYPLSNGEVLTYLNHLANDLSNRLNNITEKGKDLKDILDSFTVYNNELLKLNKIQKDYEKVFQLERSTKLDYTNQYNKFMFNIAGIMAETLIDGEKCPVCGSKCHPEKAIKCDNALSKEELNELKVSLEKIEEKSRNLQNSMNMQMVNVDNLNSNIMERVKKYNITQDMNVKEQVSTLKDNLANEYGTINKRIQEVQKDIQAMTKVQEDLNQLNVEYISIETSIKNKVSQINETSIQYEVLKDEYFKLLEEFSIQDESAHLKLLKDYNQCDILEKEVYQYYADKSSNQRILKDYIKLVGDSTIIDTKSLLSDLNSMNDYRDTLLSKRSSISEDITTNTNVYNEVSSMVETLEIKRKKYLDTLYLFNVASGTKSTDNGKISFEGFVQAYYFEQILECANKKIQIMSSGRYSLVRKEFITNKSNRTNLDIEVFDAYTCSRRNASTLSGGESFMASLSLALGLSEIVQNNIGGIQIDAMFIDEGFGTLDSDLSLQQAMKILDNLATNNRIVGIISHVEDLQEHISRKLYVKKSQYGSSIRVDNY